MGETRRNASYNLFVKLCSSRLVLDLENETGKTMAKFKFNRSDLVSEGKNIGFSHLNQTENVTRGGTITTVTLSDLDGNVLITGIPFAADNSSAFRFRHKVGDPDSLTFIDGEDIRWTKGIVACSEYRVLYREAVKWTWDG